MDNHTRRGGHHAIDLFWQLALISASSDLSGVLAGVRCTRPSPASTAPQRRDQGSVRAAAGRDATLVFAISQ